MSLVSTQNQTTLVLSQVDAVRQVYYPSGTVRCDGIPVFRSQSARDLACLLDVDHEVTSWRCMPFALNDGDQTHVPDFLVERADCKVLMDALETPGDVVPEWISVQALASGHPYLAVSPAAPEYTIRLQNSQDLLRYAHWRCPLGDRIRLLAGLDEHGSMTVAEAMSAFRETPPIAGLSSLLLHRFVEVDLDAIIGPDTTVRRVAG
ncbi:hypothetical protein ACFWXH_04550 [Mesorhizobium sp. NPDC059054]|uniref:hypothetical protein n=1 Tax=Mesorhizobium sp. NPDC059054 TaxID=3346711 RepID=UPI0036BF73E6